MIENINSLSTPTRFIDARAELYSGSALVKIFKAEDALKSIKIERVGEESKFFGFGVCQKLNLHLIDKNREINISTENTLKIYFNDGSGLIKTSPEFYITEVNRDENTNELSITAYDVIYKVINYNFAALQLSTYSIYDVVSAIANFIGTGAVEIVGVGEDETCFNTYYESGANFDGTETLREVLDAAAEATQTIYYINSKNKLTFKRLAQNDAANLTISKDNYFNLDSGTNKRLATITHSTELGDNVSASLTQSGSTQFVRNNPFWEMREDIATLVDNALAAVGGLTINQFNCDWRGNYYLEIGDKIELITKDNGSTFSYVLNDTIEYNGSLKEHTEWNYQDNSNETASNPTSLGEALKNTFARVDKANKQIELVASEVEANRANLAQLQVSTESISATVKSMEETTTNALDSASEEIANLKSEVEAKMSAEDVTLAITKELENGTSKVITKTGFTFDDAGLTVEKTNSEMKTQITEDGMKVYKNDEEVLTANNVGVNAKNLHATTYLIIGTNSRFEDYGSNRTGCFWVGGAN